MFTYFILFTFALLFNKTFSIPIDVYTDNRSLDDIPQMQFQKKRLRVDIAMIRDNILNNQVTVHWLTTTEQVANVLTKEGVSSEILLKHLNKYKLSKYNQI